MKTSFKRLGAVLFAVLIVALLLGGLTACSKKEPKITEATVGFMSSLSGTFAGVAETQRKAYVYAIEAINEQGGLSMPWGKVKLNTVIADDEAKLDIGVQRFRDMVEKGVIGVTGGIWNPMSSALNEEAKVNPVIYIAGYLPAIDIFKKGLPSDCTFTAAYTPWTLGYLTGQAVIKDLGKKKIYFVERSDSWGQTIKAGLELACSEFGGEIVGISQVPLGTAEYSAVINKAIQVGADAFVTSMFGGDAIANIKQAYDMGLTQKAVIFNCSITNVVAAGLPPKALENLYGIAYFYWNLAGYSDQEAVERVKKFSEGYMKRWNEPPDAMSGSVYVALEAMFQAAQKAGSFEPLKVSEALLKNEFITIKGKTRFRADHQPIMDQACYLVRGKAEANRSGNWDYFDVVAAYGGEKILPPLSMMGY